VFLPCELIEANGDTLKACILQHARDWGLGEEFANWVETACIFANTLVDRIVTGYPEAEAQMFWKSMGYEDRLLVAGELFHLWVIEGPESLQRELPFHQAGLNVVWTDTLMPYRSRKVRLLNGAHTSGALAAYLSGLTTVREMMEDDVLGAHVRRTVFEEILPTVSLAEEERRAYAHAVLERFANPFIHHRLLDIALNSVSKWRVRVLPSLLDYVTHRAALPRNLVFSLAALFWFYRCVPNPDGGFSGTRDGAPYPVQDAPSVLQTFSQAWREADEQTDLDALVDGLLRDASLWGMDLTAVPGLCAATTANLRSIAARGAKSTAATLGDEER